MTSNRFAEKPNLMKPWWYCTHCHELFRSQHKARHLNSLKHALSRAGIYVTGKSDTLFTQFLGRVDEDSLSPSEHRILRLLTMGVN